MARSRSSLKPDMFPFLAVLLCTMGSLIVVLLVLDTQARKLAKQRAEAKVKSIEKKQEEEIAKRRAEAQAKAEERRKHLQAIRENQNKLKTQLQQLQAQYRELQQEKKEYELAKKQTLYLVTSTSKSIENEQKQLAAIDKEKANLAARVAKIQKQIEEQKQELRAIQNVSSNMVDLQSKMRAEVDLLIKQLDKELSEKKRLKKTWSIIPYNGTRGADKMPIYVECAKDGLIFYPDKKKITDRFDRVTKIRQEVEARRELFRDSITGNDNEYWLLLVRPDGIPGYYQFQSAVKDLDILFGYELIDAEWELNLPLASALPARKLGGGSGVKTGGAGNGNNGPSPKGGGGNTGPAKNGGTANKGKKPGNGAGVAAIGKPTVGGSKKPGATKRPQGSSGGSKTPEGKGNSKKGSARKPLRPGYRLGDQDWELIVECTSSQVRIRPSTVTIDVDNLYPGKAGADLLYLTVKRLIDQQTAKLRARKNNETPQIKFMVDRDALRTYHLAYPILNNIPVIKTAYMKEE